MAAADGPVQKPGRLPEQSSNEPGPSWDPRAAWQRATDGSWRAVFQRRPVEIEKPAEIVPVVKNRPFRVPRAMMPRPVEMAPAVEPLAEAEAGKITPSPCRKALNSSAPKSTAAQDAEFVASLQRVIDVIRKDPVMPPPGFEVKMGCEYERRTDGTGIYRGKITLLFYPYSDKNHYWHGGLEFLVNDLGVMGPRNNDQDRASDPNLVFDLPAPATYRGVPYLSNEGGVWGGIYLTHRAQDLYGFQTYREWLDENLPKYKAEYDARQAEAEAHPSVRTQVIRNNFQSLYERALITSQRTPADELNTSMWLADMGPSDAANESAHRQARLNVPGYFNRSLPVHSIQLINILTLHSKYNHLHAVLEKLDYAALLGLVQ